MTKKGLPPADRWWMKVDQQGPNDCWMWTGAVGGSGYGNFWKPGYVRAHRFGYELLVGPIPEGLQLDHLCRNTCCVNPEHLEPVTAQVNSLRGISPSALHAVKTHCPAGHSYDGANTRRYRGMRYCRACHREQERERKHRVREMGAA